MAVLKNDGYDLPARVPVSLLGGVSLLLAPFGGHGVVLAAISAAMCTGPECHPDPQQRWKAGVVAALSYLLVAAVGGSLVALLLVLPKALVMAAAALALFGTLASSLTAALAMTPARGGVDLVVARPASASLASARRQRWPGGCQCGIALAATAALSRRASVLAAARLAANLAPGTGPHWL
jgi:benzoate membrane transport protein